jgi:hypothetical protein
MSNFSYSTTRISGGNSIVFLTQTEAIQKFRSQIEYNHVKKVVNDLSKTDYIHAWVDSEYYTYNLKDILVLPQSTQDLDQTIQWPRVECLNELEPNIKRQMILQNIEKLLWNILKAIVGLNLNGYVHNDVSLDNIGIHKETFVLYDYNMSKRGSDMIRDLNSFKRSIRFHLGEDITSDVDIHLGYIESMSPLDDFVYLIQRRRYLSTVKETIDYLDHLTIQ